jgi:hypothetical protein
MRVRVAIALGLVVVIGVLVVVLSKSEQRLASSNAQVTISGVDLPIRPGKTACQLESVAAETTALRVFVGTKGELTGPLDVSIRSGGREIAKGSFGFVAGNRPFVAKLSRPIVQETLPARVCLRNRGDFEIRLAGDRTAIQGGANPYGVILDDEPRVDYLRSGSESWWSIAGVVAERFGRSKTSFFGPWTMWAVFGLVVGTWVVGIALLLRRQTAE